MNTWTITEVESSERLVPLHYELDRCPVCGSDDGDYLELLDGGTGWECFNDCSVDSGPIGYRLVRV